MIKKTPANKFEGATLYLFDSLECTAGLILNGKKEEDNFGDKEKV